MKAKAIFKFHLKILMKNRGLVLPIIMVLNLVLSTIILFNLRTIISIAELSGEMSYESYTNVFEVLKKIEVGFVLIIVPGIASSSTPISIANKRLDLILQSNTSPFQIISGIYGAIIVYLCMFSISTLPIVSCLFIFRMVNLPVLFSYAIFMLTLILCHSALAILISCTLQETLPSVLVSYILIYLLCGTFYQLEKWISPYKFYIYGALLIISFIFLLLSARSLIPKKIRVKKNNNMSL